MARAKKVDTANANTPATPATPANTPANNGNGNGNDGNANTPASFNTGIDFIDYLPSKVAGMTMIMIEGRRIQHDQPIGVCASGKVTLKSSGKTIFFGTLTIGGLSLSSEALLVPVRTADAISMEDIAAMKGEIEKTWCYGVKLENLKAKTQKDSEKKQSKFDKMRAIATML